MESRPSKPIRIASWPPPYAPNQYLPLFYKALAPYGIEHVPGLPLATKTILDPAFGISMVHIHWPDPYWRDRHRRLPRRLFRVARFYWFLHQMRRHHIPVIWTVHDVQSHLGNSISDQLGNGLLYRRADLCIFHSESARAAARDLYGERKKKTLLMPHGNYDGVLPAPRAKEHTRRALGISPTRKIILCFGRVQRNKGFDLAVQALDYLDGDEFHLIIAGLPIQSRSQLLGQGRSAVPNTTLLLEEVDNQQLADLLEAADVAVLPYREITGSGSLLHALTVGKGVVTSDLPFFREVLSHAPDAGVLVPRENPMALAEGIREFFRMAENRRERAARELADFYAWPRLVPPVAAWILANAATNSVVDLV